MKIGERWLKNGPGWYGDEFQLTSADSKSLLYDLGGKRIAWKMCEKDLPFNIVNEYLLQTQTTKRSSIMEYLKKIRW